MRKPETAANGRAAPGPLAPKQEAVALLLAAGRTIEQAAREARVGSRTVRTWLAEGSAFRERVQSLRSEMTAAALGRLLDNMASAADTLGYLARKGKSEMTRYVAARAVLELGPKLREATELADRVAALEARQAAASLRV
jgi:hypothetical protein